MDKRGLQAIRIMTKQNFKDGQYLLDTIDGVIHVLIDSVDYHVSDNPFKHLLPEKHPNTGDDKEQKALL